MSNKKHTRLIFAIALLAVAISCASVAFSVSANRGGYLKSVPLYSVTSVNSSAEYGANEKAPDLKGVKVKLFAGDEFRFNQPVDLRGMTSGDPLAEICVIPETLGEKDVSSLTITLTDVYDKNNSVRVDFHESSAQPEMCYVLAGATDQPLTGRENGGKLHRSNLYGQWCFMSFGGLSTVHHPTIDQNRICLAYDFKNCSVNLYAKGSTLPFAKFDSGDYFQNLWSGFTTGEVFVSVKCGGYTKSHANFVITRIAGCDLSEKDYKDDKAPAVTLKDGEYQGTVPDGVKGVPYPVFESFAADNYSGYLKTKVNVYRNYYMNSKVSVTFDKNSGTFTPESAGVYYVEYSATDDFGNSGVKVVEVNVREKAEPIIVDFEGGSATGLIGEKISLPKVNVSGGSGILAQEGRVYLQNDQSVTCKITDGDFTPFNKGTFVYEVTVTDYLGLSAKGSFNIAVNPADAPVFTDSVDMPKYFLLNKAYKLPEVFAYDYSDLSGRAVKTTVIEKKNGRETQVNGDYIPAEAGEVGIIFRADNGKAVSEIEYFAEIIDVSAAEAEDEIDISKYFKTNGMNAESYETYTELVATEDNATAEFIMPLSRSTFKMDFAVQKAQFKTLNIYLSDYSDRSKQIKLTYENAGGGATVFYINDNKAGGISLSFRLDGNFNELTVSSRRQTVIADSVLGSRMNMTSYSDGSALATDLFRTKCYVSFEFCGVTGEAGIILRRLGGQALNNSVYDTQEPVIALAFQQFGNRSINSTYVLEPAFVFDTLDSEVASYLSVVCPDKSFMVSEEGITLNRVSVEQAYTLRFNEYGSYKIIYYAADSSGNENINTGFVVNVIDEEKPVLTVNEEPAKQISLGDTLYVPGCGVSDNYSTKISVMVYVVTPDGYYYVVTGDGFKPARVGKYNLRYVATDEAGNMSVVSFGFTVTNG